MNIDNGYLIMNISIYQADIMLDITYICTYIHPRRLIYTDN